MRRILMVDDEAHVLSALQRTLRRFLPEGEAEIETCLDPEQALLRCAETTFDVVMSDYRMPGLSGADFLQMVKGLQPDAVRLVLSASNDITEVMNAINRAEVFRYVAKPWDAEELEKVFAQAFARHDESLQARRRLDRSATDGRLSPQELEARRLEAEEPGITRVRRDSDGAVHLD
jgi:two-component system probable response regulator PhcQ